MILIDDRKANVLVNGKIKAVLCDFGLAKALGTGSQGLTTTAGFKGSIAWCSPELLDDSPRTPASDMWAWAFLVWEVRSLPYVTFSSTLIAT